MKTYILVGFLMIVIFACTKPATSVEKNGVFDDLTNLETVVITLSDYNLDSVPGDIIALKDAERLLIYRDQVVGWEFYTPQQATIHAATPPFRKLPAEITTLDHLTALSLIDLDLVALPDDFYRLENLDTLSLSMNKLTISEEVDKINKLKNLKYLALYGNKVDSADIQRLKTANPNLRIVSDIE